MSGETCAVLTAVFPLILLAFLAERRSLRLKVRRNRFFRGVAEYTVFVALSGLIFSVVGTQLNGLNSLAAVLAWTQFAVTMAGLFVLAGFHIASAEVDEDEGTATA